MIVLTFFTYNYLDACLCWMITWNRITTPKTEFIFDLVPASLVHTEFWKFLTMIHIMIFLTHMTWALTFLFFPCDVCLGCIRFHSSVFVIWPLRFVQETVKSIWQGLLWELSLPQQSSQELQILHSSADYFQGVRLVSCTVYMEYLEHSK